jgi:uncharacterized protein with HEPN domain
MKHELGSVSDIIIAAGDIPDCLRAVSKELFLTNMNIRKSVLYDLQVIGEATKRLSAEFRTQHSTIPWRDMAGLRDRLIHAYDNVDLEKVWEAAAVQLPIIRLYLEDLLKSSPKEPPL